ncbi:MAG TPA: glycosyltransferase family 2 protein [Stellaceae bacterium]|nr:glycosyltransferase family 2 protein [Stellaceae bacterium]
MHVPRVSYVVTVYNKAPYLPFVVAGLAAQSGDFAREFIFVDDGSSDDSRAVLERLTAGWPERRLIAQANRGPALALNAGLAAARGEFIKTLDGDDMLTPEATATLLGAVASGRAGFAFGTAGTYVPADGLDAAQRQAQACRGAGGIELVPEALRASLRRAQTTTSSWLARADLVHAVGGADEGVFVQDYSIELRLAEATAFARVPLVVYLAPSAAPGRQSEQGAQELHDLNLAVARFVERRPRLPRSLQRHALRRTAGRAWHYAHRQAGQGYASRAFWRHALAQLGLVRADAAAIRVTCDIFRRADAIKLVAAP